MPKIFRHQIRKNCSLMSHFRLQITDAQIIRPGTQEEVSCDSRRSIKCCSRHRVKINTIAARSNMRFVEPWCGCRLLCIERDPRKLTDLPPRPTRIRSWPLIHQLSSRQAKEPTTRPSPETSDSSASVAVALAMDSQWYLLLAG